MPAFVMSPVRVYVPPEPATSTPLTTGSAAVDRSPTVIGTVKVDVCVVRPFVYETVSVISVESRGVTLKLTFRDWSAPRAPRNPAVSDTVRLVPAAVRVMPFTVLCRGLKTATVTEFDCPFM